MTILIEMTVLLIGAFALSRIAAALKLPPLLGMLAAGVVLKALKLPMPSATIDVEAVSTEVRLAILAIVLLRAGLGLEFSEIKKSGPLAIRMGVLPLLGDILFVSVCAHLLLGFSLTSSLVMGTLLGAISPAIVIPALLTLLETRRGKTRKVLQSLLVGATLDNTFAVILLGLTVEMAVSTNLNLSDHLVLLPFKLVGGVIGGLVLGACIGVLQRFNLLRHPGARTLFLWGGAGGLIVIAQFIPISFVIGIIVAGSVVRTRYPELGKSLSANLQQIWKIAQYALFALIGYAVDLDPLSNTGWSLVAIILTGQLGRALFSWLATSKQGLTSGERSACILSYVPKATIQAAFAALPLDQGMPEGHVLMGAAILAILITAPLGVISLGRGVDQLLPRTQ